MRAPSRGRGSSPSSSHDPAAATTMISPEASTSKPTSKVSARSSMRRSAIPIGQVEDAGRLGLVRWSRTWVARAVRSRRFYGASIRAGNASRGGRRTRLCWGGMSVATLTFADRLAAEVERKRSQLVVGLDPQPDLLPVELRGDVARFCCGIVDAVAPHAVAVKPQLAFFEALGAEGMARSPRSAATRGAPACS